jgi:hypothetical protein
VYIYIYVERQRERERERERKREREREGEGSFDYIVIWGNLEITENHICNPTIPKYLDPVII